MASAKPRVLLALEYEEHAQAYLRSLPPEHFMEATAQATQRKITLESLDLVRARRPDFWLFNELLVQYPRPRQRKPGQVVPDNMVVICDQPIKADSSFNTPLEPAGPYWVLEYVSKSNKRKDYEDNFQKYERELRVPYYLLFYPDTQDFALYRHNGRKYVSVPPNDSGRHPLRELDLEVGLLDGWVRFWYMGELLPLPADLQRDLDEARRQLELARQQADVARQQADEARRQSDEARRQAEELQQRLDEERQAKQALEREVAELRARLESPDRPTQSS